MENKYLLSGFSFENEEQYNKFKNILIRNNYLNYKQKEEIYKGLIDNLDIKLYISPNYDSEVMNLIRKSLKDNLNITHLLKGKNRYDKYELLKNIYQLQIKNKIDLPDKILNKITDIEKLSVLSKWSNEGLDNNTFIENKLYKFKTYELQKFKYCIKNNLDTSYFNKGFSSLELDEIIYGLKEKLDVSIYANHKFDYKQMEQIRLGLLFGIDVSIYAKYEFDYEQMEQIRDGLYKDIDISWYNNPNLNWLQMQEIKLGIIEGIDVSYFAKIEYSWLQMQEIRLGLKSGIEVNWYLNPNFTEKQMEQIRLGLIEKMDVSWYNNPKISAQRMEQIRTFIKFEDFEYLKKFLVNILK